MKGKPRTGEHVWAWIEPKRAAGANPRRNAERERIWFSPHCLAPALEGPLFAAGGGL